MKHSENNIDKRTERKKIGDLGEKIAAEWLQMKKFKIIEKNYLKKWGEIDIIAEKENKVHFVEVKSVSHENLSNISRETDVYRPEDNIHPQKLKRLSRTIQSYVLEKLGDDKEWQFDAMTVYLDEKNKKAKVKILEDLVL
jgi:putative endonuclease